MLQYTYRWYFYVMLVCVIATACQLGGSPQPENDSASAVPPSPSPTLSTPTAANDEPLTIPTPAPNTAVVHGQIGEVAPENRMFLSGEIYLAPVVELQGDNPLPFIRLEPDKNPKATTRNDTQEFIISDVEPGNYGLVFHTPIDDWILPAENRSFRIIEVTAGETIDLGEIDLQ